MENIISKNSFYCIILLFSFDERHRRENNIKNIINQKLKKLVAGTTYEEIIHELQNLEINDEKWLFI